VAPMAAARSRDVAFVVVAGASGLPADRTQLWSNRTQLAAAGVRPSLIDPIGVDASRVLIAAHLFGDVRHDPAVTLTEVRQPVLAVFGENDRSTPPGESLRIFRDSLAAGGNRHHTLRVVAGADHSMRADADGFATSNSAPFAAGYLDLVTTWITNLDPTSSWRTVDTPPAQQLTSTPTAPPSWYETPAVQAGALLAMLVLFGAYPVGALVRRLRGRRCRLPVRWSSRVTATAGVVTVLGTATYLMSVVMTGATTVRTSALGRPPAWLALQLMAVTAVGAAAVAARGWVRATRGAAGGADDGGRLQGVALLSAVVLFAPWAASWGLFTIW
jgi:uncharacterized protein